jgi:hypothetical protein
MKVEGEVIAAVLGETSYVQEKTARAARPIKTGMTSTQSSRALQNFKSRGAVPRLTIDPIQRGPCGQTVLPNALFLTAVPVLAVFAIMDVRGRKRVTGLRANFPIACGGEHHHGQAGKHGKSFSHCRFLGCMNETLQRKAAAVRRVGAMKIS